MPVFAVAVPMIHTSRGFGAVVLSIPNLPSITRPGMAV